MVPARSPNSDVGLELQPGTRYIPRCRICGTQTMKVLDPGHVYQLNTIDNGPPQFLCFVKRDNPPEKYPGNVGHHGGVQVQEILRVLIDRLGYVDKQIPDAGTQRAREYLTQAIWELEDRAKRRRDETLDHSLLAVAYATPCITCGHVYCTKHPVT